VADKLKQELGRIDLGETSREERHGWLAAIGRYLRRQVLRSTSTRR
jgi:hypothetical protein